jgi:hypothetical protein
MIDPRIYLLQDNCFAIKRWVEPKTWGPLIRDIGFTNIEASFDNEMDFFYTPKAYRDAWFKQLDAVEQKEKIKVRTFYTGYQTYRTVGLLHPDPEMRQYLIDGWIRPAVETLGARGLDMGFALHAYPEKVLQDPELYDRETRALIDLLAQIAHLAKENGGISVCAEAMYDPHQTPFTIEGTKALLKSVYQKNGDPIYTTIDMGHMAGQRRFLKPQAQVIEAALHEAIAGRLEKEPWLGSDRAYAIWDQAIADCHVDDRTILAIAAEMDRCPYLFANSEADSDPYAWLETLGCYSPIMHMQQTDGFSSSHAAFTPETNHKGIIKGKQFLEAIAASYQQEEDPAMPPKATEINLAFEIFASNSEHPREIIAKLKATCRYWRQFVPEDGLPLSQLIARL